MDIPDLKKTVAPVRRMVQVCHSANISIIFPPMVQSADFKDAGFRLERRPALKEVDSLAAGAWDAELDPRMDVQTGDYILDKTHYSSFYNTNLECILRGLAVDTL